jgi:hypothetical protein
MKIISAKEARDRMISYDKKLQDIGISIMVATNLNLNHINEEVMLNESDIKKLKNNLEELGYIVEIMPIFNDPCKQYITIKW